MIMEMREEPIVEQRIDNDSILNEKKASEPVCETIRIDESSEPDIDSEATQASHRIIYAGIPEILEAARAMSDLDADSITREDLANLKQQFYAFRHTQQQAEREAAIASGELAPDAQLEPQPNEDEEELRRILDIIKEKKARHLAMIEAQRQENLEKRNAIIDQLLAMSADADNVNREFPRFKELQQQFKEIGEVPATETTGQWKRYQDAIERFYDQYRINKDLRDYDFRKNLETKTLLCDEAESLATEEDVVVAFKRLQALHDTWRDTGPVAKEMREEIWNRFKDASAVVNKRYQAFFEERKAREQHNEDAKTALCERVESIDIQGASSFKQWDDLTALILAAQEEWRGLGYASRRNNNKLFARFRAACDNFFSAKAEYFKVAKERQNENLKLKTQLCEQAEALKDSTEWKKTADKLVDLQRRWKTIGAVPKKQSDALWARFQQACDYFFEQKKKDLSDSRHAEQAALKAKRNIISEITAVGDDRTADEVQALLRDADDRWRQAGHVPFREKDKVYEEYRAAVNALRDRYKLSRNSRSMARFENTLADIGSDQGRMNRERERLVRACEIKRQELKTCENNVGFFTTKSSRGNSMLQELDRRIAAIKEEIETLQSKIAILDEKMA